MVPPQILEDDSLIVVLRLPAILSQKFTQKISVFYFVFSITHFCGAIVITLLNNEWNLLLSQYVAYISGGPLVFAAYTIMYQSSYQKMYNALCSDIFPLFWPLRSLGNEDFNKFQKLAKMAIRWSKIVIVLALATAIGALPWFGIEIDYDFILPVKVAMDNCHGWLLKTFLIMFYSSYFHMTLTVVSNIFILAYLVLHLYNQIRMLKVRLGNLSNGPDLAHAIYDPAYQEFAKTELISCIKLHQVLLKYTQRINDYVYYPIFHYAAGAVLVGVSLILIPKNSLIIVIRIGCIALIAATAAVTFCVSGQLLEDESERIFVHAYNTPWVLWNTQNRKLIGLLLFKAQDTLVLSSSGLITLNYQLLIRLYRTIYSTLMFLLNVSETV